MSLELNAEKLKKVFETEKLLNEIRDTDVLLERILTEARAIANADAGSIYVIEDKQPSGVPATSYADEENAFKDKLLRIKYSQTDTLQKTEHAKAKYPYVYFTVPITKTSISGYCACTGTTLNIPDAYNIDKNTPYKFNSAPDISTGYKTVSMLTVPLITSSGHTLGVLQIINAKDENEKVVPFSEESVEFIKQFASSVTQALEHTYLTSNMIKRMQRMAEFRDPKETGTHVERVSDFSLEIYDQWAVNHNVPKEERMKYRDALKIAAKCHDLGKVGISDVILKKPGPGRFTPEERSIMMGHTCVGAQLFTEPESEIDEMSRDVALHHHEWWDGSEKGYPGKIDYISYEIGKPIGEITPIKGEEIPLSARIVAIADVFDALSHARVYKEAWSIDDAFIEIQNLSGKQFDPSLVLAFLEVKDRIISINAAYERMGKK
ncbi:GAF domain-containing protein [Treponema ruminis]|uniref:HD-GYP domain-containing protein (C-di-GMP phosphodiesterase class II) n=1 Tax=Treponema ruminis TaxID=744515 RepID=A0A7W8LMB0_9SPIR|nr:HD domain-containing phosphohydrolase [Treponema ruminis]MBB5226205.1 HD-GYP domain-containing protein (c-di-GMP phosphodiesterase class II) [Treponema ruminis]QSI02888.1 GAF domain-containing protein [Treponema ruminis]